MSYVANQVKLDRDMLSGYPWQSRSAKYHRQQIRDPGRPCPIAASLELVGERWALLVVREIVMGNTRFSDIVRGTGAPRDRIAARLKALAAAGVIRCEPNPGGRRHAYSLTESGADLVPVLNALLACGDRHAVAADDPKRPAGYRKLITPDTKAEEDA